MLYRKLRTGSEAAKEPHLSEDSEKVHHGVHHPSVPIVPPPIRGKDEKARIVTVCNDMFYAEQGRRLFKWRLGDPKWTNTGLTDRDERSYEDPGAELKLAVSGETVYVGKRNGKLFSVA